MAGTASGAVAFSYFFAGRDLDRAVYFGTAAPVGAFGAMALSRPAPQSKKAGASFREAVAEQNIQKNLRDRVAKLLEMKSRSRSHMTEEPFMLAANTNGAKRRETARVDTLLDIQIKRVSVTALESPRTPLVLVVPVNIRLIRVRDGAVLYEGCMQYDTKPHSFKDWSAAGGQQFRAELYQCSRALAEQIAGIF